MQGVWKRPHSNNRLSVESLMPAGTTWGLRFFLVFCSFLVLHLSLSSICSPVPSVCVSVCVCHESPCLQSHNMTERRSYQTQRGELHKWHSGARTPLENRSEGGKVRDGGREADCVYVDVLCVRGDTCFFPPPTIHTYTLASSPLSPCSNKTSENGNAWAFSLLYRCLPKINNHRIQ